MYGDMPIRKPVANSFSGEGTDLKRNRNVNDNFVENCGRDVQNTENWYYFKAPN